MNHQVPILGVCVGMQIKGMIVQKDPFRSFWINGSTIELSNECRDNYPIPNMGWRDITPSTRALLFPDNSSSHSFYFTFLSFGTAR